VAVELQAPSAGVRQFLHPEVAAEVLFQAHPLGAEVLFQAHPLGAEGLFQAHPLGAEVPSRPAALAHPAALDHPFHPAALAHLFLGHPLVEVGEVAEAVGVGAAEVLCPDHPWEVVGGVGAAEVLFRAHLLAGCLSGGRQGHPSVAGSSAPQLPDHRGCHQLVAAERWRQRLRASKALQKQES
jgi:hypothetical protein